MSYPKLRRGERGMALLMALVALLVISAIGMGMIFMTNTETSINANYKDAQSAFFAMRAGLEEARDRLRSASIAPIVAPTFMPGQTPSGGATSVLYITNPSGGETVDPTSSTSPYFDDEFCHEYFGTNTSMTSPGAPGVPCTSYPGGNSVSTTGGLSSSGSAPAVLQGNPLSYKWIRVTLKQNGTLPQAVVDTSQALNSQVCWYGIANQEVAITRYGYSSCSAAQTAGMSVSPVYILTSLAVTPSGSRRVGQYETGAFLMTPPPAALGFDGPGAIFSPAPNSSQYFSSGYDAAPATPTTTWGGPGSCGATGPSPVPSISTGDAQGVTNIMNSIPTNRYANYTGSGGTPSIVNQGNGGPFSGDWSSPADLNTFVNALANAADVSYNCGYSNTTLSPTQTGAACSPGVNLGSDANPQITFVNGDLNMGSNTGAGILVVTGSLYINGNSGFDGLVLVIGQGYMSEQGSGHGQFNGSIFLANTNSHAAPYSQLPALGTPILAWNGGGTNGIQYNSCWANIGNQLHYMIVSAREEMY